MFTMTNPPSDIDTIDVLDLYRDQSIISVGDDGDIEVFYDDYCVEFSDSDII